MFVNEKQVEIARPDQKHILSGWFLPSQGTAEDWAIQQLGTQIARTEKAMRTIRVRVYCAAAYYCCWNILIEDYSMSTRSSGAVCLMEKITNINTKRQER